MRGETRTRAAATRRRRRTSSTRRRHGRLSSAWLVCVSSFLRRCASSQMSRSQHVGHLANALTCSRNVSYEMISTWGGGREAAMRCADARARGEAPSRGWPGARLLLAHGPQKGFQRLHHLRLGRLRDGQRADRAVEPLAALRVPVGHERRGAHDHDPLRDGRPVLALAQQRPQQRDGLQRLAQPLWRRGRRIGTVFTHGSTCADAQARASCRTISSARMQPAPSKPRAEVTHSNMNCTPSLWCGRSHCTSTGSTVMAVPPSGSASPGGGHSWRGGMVSGSTTVAGPSAWAGANVGSASADAFEPHGTCTRCAASRAAREAAVRGA